ncbi:hypothetical protein LTR69_002012 [Exophiala sideris]|uniref:Uncharacterized protein n=1 Tax=Exophiala sideris TaxID=1016849 RepID=A0ABR0JKZ9_9EURO|nr:hypothetical protein LTR69_002012 [Exophiala sideris]
MPLLSRKTSKESLGDKRAVSVERTPIENKPSLLRRLSKKVTRSEEPLTQPEKKQVDAQQEHQAGHRNTTENLVDKVPHPQVAEVPPASTPQDTPRKQNESEVHPGSPAIYGHPLTTTRSAAEPQGQSTHGSVPESEPESRHQHKGHNGLTKDDVQHLFSGAPQFTLEKGRRGRYFPQAFFPWNNDLEISDLQDRRYLRHESFALCTLHAHLPIPDEVDWVPGKAPPVKHEGLEIGKRPMFELGIFERPNMLALDGREPGTIGMRYFLERPVADGIADEKVREHGKDIEIDLGLEKSPATEAFKMLALSGDNNELNAKVGKHAPAQERVKLIHEGSRAWKTVGVRPITMETLVDRLELIDTWRDKVINAGWRVTVLDQMKSDQLHEFLFNELIYPPRKMQTDAKQQDKVALKIQIEALVKVLTTPGAWLDLSTPEARLRFGKILHSGTTHYDRSNGTMHIDPERKWLLVQLLLAIELVIRLDAALRLGIALHADQFEITPEEIHHFNKLRNLKVDWDLVAARRFLFLSYVKKIERRVPHPESQSSSPAPQHRRQSNDHHGGFMSGLRHSLGLNDSKSENQPDTCDLAILPRQPHVMVDGVLRFANNIGWPRAREIQERLVQKLCQATSADREKFLMDAVSCTDGLQPSANQSSSSLAPHITSSLETFTLDLHAATTGTIGGWLSHSWLSGLILPGTSTCDILMATLLENDTDPTMLKELGAQDHNLPFRSSGFILNGSSWWSKSSVLGRVFAPLPHARESMGWVYLPNFVPLYEATSHPVANRWLKVKTFPVPTARERPRIFDGDKLAMESTPLGVGKGGVMSSEFSMVTDHVLDEAVAPEIVVTGVKVHLSNTNATAASPDNVLSAWAQFHITISNPNSPGRPVTKQVRYGLDRAVYFVTAHPCRLPHGHATFPSGSTEQQHPRHKHSEHLPAHPLHKTYKFVVKMLDDIIHNPHDNPPTSGSAGVSEVWIVDAREAPGPVVSHAGSGSIAGAPFPGVGPDPDNTQTRCKDILVRAWCAEKGQNALISRVGRTCLSCAIREARALEIGIVVRVGVKD